MVSTVHFMLLVLLLVIAALFAFGVLVAQWNLQYMYLLPLWLYIHLNHI
jgi:hypothetical protein